jgi:hypothetical protein
MKRTMAIAAGVITTIATALHAEEPPIPFGESTVSGVRDATVLLRAHGGEYVSPCQQLLERGRGDWTWSAYQACMDLEIARGRMRAFDPLAWPNSPGRH